MKMSLRPQAWRRLSRGYSMQMWSLVSLPWSGFLREFRWMGNWLLRGALLRAKRRCLKPMTKVMVLTGNAAALRITYNGRDLGLMGKAGEVVSRVYLIIWRCDAHRHHLADADEYAACDGYPNGDANSHDDARGDGCAVVRRVRIMDKMFY